MFELLTGRVLFPVTEHTPELTHLRMIEHSLGASMPAGMRTASSQRLKAPITMALALEGRTLDESLAPVSEISSFIRLMLTVSPGERVSARDLLCHEYFRS